MVLLGSKKPANFPLGFLSSSLKLFTFVLLAWVDCSSLFVLHCVDPCWDHCRWRRMASIKVNQRNSHEGKPRCHFLGPNGQYSLYLVFLSRLLCRSPSKCTFPLYIQSKCSHNWHFENGMPHIIACVSCQSILWVTSQHLWLGCRVNANKVTGLLVDSSFVVTYWIPIRPELSETQGQVQIEDTLQYCRKTQYLRRSDKWAEHCNRESKIKQGFQPICWILCQK